MKKWGMFLTAPAKSQLTALFLLRTLIGWHFLYEGVAKLLIPDWSSAEYLDMSRWVFADFFHWMASTPSVLQVVDWLNVWGLILIGLGLFLGFFTRLASLFGMILLLLYYLAIPPIAGKDWGLPAEGQYLFINKNVIEFFALLVIAYCPTEKLWGLDRMAKDLLNKLRTKKLNGSESLVSGHMETLFSRRELIQNLISIPVLGVFFHGAVRKYRWEKVNAITGATIQLKRLSQGDLEGALPLGKIGNLRISRLIMGNNLIGGWSHSRDLIYVSSLFKAYNTEKKVMETLHLAESAGINTMFMVTGQYPLLRKYNEVMGGRMQTICQVFPNEKDMTSDIDRAIDSGATSLYIQGGVADQMVKRGRVDLLHKALEYTKNQGYVAGIGAHSILVPMACEEAGLDPDYYVKTLHHDRYWSAIPRDKRVEFSVDGKRSEKHDEMHDNMFDLFPEKTIDFMGRVAKPWIAFKVLAGGAIAPDDGISYAFQNGADFVCLGMFDFQIVEDVNIAIGVLSKTEGRERLWYA